MKVSWAFFMHYEWMRRVDVLCCVYGCVMWMCRVIYNDVSCHVYGCVGGCAVLCAWVCHVVVIHVHVD